MKKHVVLMALLCLLFVFQGAMAAATPKNLTYTGDAQALFTNQKGNNWYSATGTTSEEDFDWTSVIPTETDAGTYTYYWTNADLAHVPVPAANQVVKITGTIKKATVNLTWKFDDDTVTKVPYDGHPHIPAAESKGFGGEIEVTVKSGKTAVEEPINVGSYTATAALSENDAKNYEISTKTATFNYEITKAPVILVWSIDNTDIEIETKADLKDLEPIPYDTKSHFPTIKEVQDEDGFVLDVEEIEPAFIVKNGTKKVSDAINAGTYSVTATLDSANFELSKDAVTSFDYEIAKAALTLVWSFGEEEVDPEDMEDIPYDGDPHEATATVTDEDGAAVDVAITVKIKGPDKTFKNAGDYTATASFQNKADAANYEFDKESVNPLNYTIAKAPVTLTWKINGEDVDPEDVEDIPYDGDPHAATATAADEAGNDVEVKVNIKKGSSSANTPTNAGTYTATAVFEDKTAAANYEFDEYSVNPLVYTISKIPLSLVWKINEVQVDDPEEVEPIPYDGDAHTATAVLVDEDDAEVEFITVRVTTKGPDKNFKNAGKYTATASLPKTADAGNYDINEDAVNPLVYEIEPIEVELTWTAEETYTYNGKEQGPEATVEDLAEGVKVKISYSGLGTDAGDYTAEATAEFDPANYVLAEDEGYDYTIEPLEVTLTWKTEEEYIYNGKEQGPEATIEGLLKGDEKKYTISYSGLGTDAGEYTAEAEVTFDPENYVLADDAESVDYEILKAPITEDDFIAPKAVEEDLVYNGSDQELITAGEWTGDPMGTFLYSLDNYAPKSPEFPTEFSEDIPTGDDAGDYTVLWYIEPDDNHTAEDVANEEAPADIAAEIAKAELDPSMITVSPAKVYYDGTEHSVNYTVNGDDAGLQDDDWEEDEEKTQLTGRYIDSYNVCIKAAEDSVNFTGTACTTWQVAKMESPYVFDMFEIGGGRLGGGSSEQAPTAFLQQNVLPATGFPTRFAKPLSVRPAGFDYVDLGMRIQIPTIGIDVELAGIPEDNGTWPVEWLGNRAGILSGSYVPGQGFSMIAAHNHLNKDEIGPFLMIRELQENDIVFINKPDGSLLRFRVFANELIGPNDMQQLASIAEKEENTLTLVTCENEAADGGYLNRRVVFAKPLN